MLTRLASALADRYRIERELGSGGMATVYLAEDLKHHRRVAIKVLRPDLAASVGAGRFLREIEICAQLQHPNILPLLDSGEADGLLYYVMPYVEGHSLRHRLTKQGELPVGEAVRILVEVVDALAHAHARGVVHRDIKPDNVMLSGRHALVADFGVARALSEATGQQTMTTAGIALGTPAYMSPEQAMGDPLIDHRTDIYAVGAMAYELLTGRPPFTGRSPQQVLSAHVTEAPEPVTAQRPGVSPALEQLVMQCLAKRPADRFQSAEDLLAQLEPLATPSGGTHPTEARLAAAPAPAGQRWRRAVGVAVAIVLALALWQGISRARGSGVDGGLTLGTAVRLTADEGLEIQPAISPDGRLVAYAAGQASQMRIYIRPTTGGRTIALSEQPTVFEFQPRWSPDGTQILYLTRDGAFVASALGGQSRRVAEGGDSLSGSASTVVRVRITAAAWSPDGRRIVVARGAALSIRNIDTGAEQALGASAHELHSCDWSPRDDWIACVSGNAASMVPGPTFGNIAPSAIVVVRPGGGPFIEVTDRSVLHESPVWSPDGRHLFFVSNRQGPRDVYVVEIGDDGRAPDAPRRVTTGLDAHSIAFSADGSALVYGSYTARANIWSLPIPTAGPVNASVAARPLTSGNQRIESMKVSPDGRWLVYDSNLHGNADIFRVPVAGGTPERLTSDPADEFAGDLSPNGREVAFHSWRTGSRDIFVKPLDGGPIQQVTNTPSQESYPRWSPDGGALAIYDQRIEGGSPLGILLTHRDDAGAWSPPQARQAGALAPTWLPDGRLLALRGDDAIEVIPADSGPPGIVYAASASADPMPRFPTVSADGHSIYFKSHDADGRAMIWSVPVAGGRPRLLVRLDDLARPSTRPDFAAGAGRFFFTLDERESDIWVVDVARP